MQQAAAVRAPQHVYQGTITRSSFPNPNPYTVWRVLLPLTLREMHVSKGLFPLYALDTRPGFETPAVWKPYTLLTYILCLDRCADKEAFRGSCSQFNFEIQSA